MASKTLGLLHQPIGVESLDGRDDLRVKGAAPIVQKTAVGDVVGEAMLEGVFDLGKAARFVEEISRHEVPETVAELLLWEVGDGSEKSEPPITAADCAA
jgi:hypothetical protein